MIKISQLNQNMKSTPEFKHSFQQNLLKYQIRGVGSTIEGLAIAVSTRFVVASNLSDHIQNIVGSPFDFQIRLSHILQTPQPKSYSCLKKFIKSTQKWTQQNISYELVLMMTEEDMEVSSILQCGLSSEEDLGNHQNIQLVGAVRNNESNQITIGAQTVSLTENFKKQDQSQLIINETQVKGITEGVIIAQGKYNTTVLLGFTPFSTDENSKSCIMLNQKLLKTMYDDQRYFCKIKNQTQNIVFSQQIKQQDYLKEEEILQYKWVLVSSRGDISIFQKVKDNKPAIMDPDAYQKYCREIGH